MYTFKLYTHKPSFNIFPKFYRSFSNFHKPLDSFLPRHLGNNNHDLKKMAQAIGYQDVDHLVGACLPDRIKFSSSLEISDAKWSQIPQIGLGEQEAITHLRRIASKNRIMKNLIGMGYHGTITPPVIQRHILENPGWYTPYTPYQAEIAQGRMEMLFNFQTLITDLTDLPYANASLLDESTACVEAMMVSYHHHVGLKKNKNRENKSKYRYYVDINCHPQNIMVLEGRAERLNIELVVKDFTEWDFNFSGQLLGGLIQYPNTYGQIYSSFKLHNLISEIHTYGGLITMACDLMSLVLLTPPGQFNADIALGNAQRFGIPLGGGGPHPAFFSVRKGLERLMPGRIIGRSGEAFRMTMQTREQHIKREKATSNICTSQALLANVAGAYAIYHGSTGLGKIAHKIHWNTKLLSYYLLSGNKNIKLLNSWFFDTLHLSIDNPKQIQLDLEEIGYNIRLVGDEDSKNICLALDETIEISDVQKIASTILGIHKMDLLLPADKDYKYNMGILPDDFRENKILNYPIFSKFHSETEIMRYLFRLQKKDLGLNTSMIPLGSCTMKLNAVTEMLPLSWPEFSQIHPYAPRSQMQGFIEMTNQLKKWLAEVTGFADVSLQPISGAVGEYTGLVVIANYLKDKSKDEGGSHRNICLIPDSAHGTNPASARLAGFEVVIIKTDREGNIDFEHLKKSIHTYQDRLACLMITYPSTFGVFEDRITEICQIIHQAGGLVYMDGANMNAQLGLTSPFLIGADVCHLNLHKTFCIPHGGGGPGMGPIGVASHLVNYLPQEVDMNTGLLLDYKRNITKSITASMAWGSGLILPISYQYIAMMGQKGLLEATKGAIVAANYMKHRLMGNYPILFTNKNGCVAHEFILDIRPELKRTGINATDIAKRLQDYGFHGPTVSWPVSNILMLEPTESENITEIDRYCDALIEIKKEINQIAWQISEFEKVGNTKAIQDLKTSNILKNSPHTLDMIINQPWSFPYTPTQAVYPMGKESKIHWPSVSRIDDLAGDKKLITNWGQMEK